MKPSEGGRGLPQGGHDVRYRSGITPDLVDTAGALFHAFGAILSMRRATSS